ncbi:hypothetical protein VTG60DRAFT_6331 [Thermothelomyces hinnuleus]
MGYVSTNTSNINNNNNMPLGLDVLGVVVQFVGIFLALGIAWHQDRESADSRRTLKAAEETARRDIETARREAEVARQEAKRDRDQQREAAKD